VVVSHAVFIPKKDRGKGAGITAGWERIALAADLGYDLMLCTVVASNVVQQKVLAKCGWLMLTTFWSQRSDCVIQLWGKHLQAPDSEPDE
jgi:hypothetical protein